MEQDPFDIEDDSQSIDEIERLLMSMPLRQPSAMLDARIGRLTAGRSKRSMPAHIAAAAVVLLAMGAGVYVVDHSTRSPRHIANPGPVPTHKGPATIAINRQRPQPIELVRTLSTTTADGIITVDGQPVSCVRRLTMQQVLVIDPDGGRHVSYRLPRQEIAFARAAAY